MNPNDGMPCVVCGKPYDKLPKGRKPKSMEQIGAIINRATKPDPGPNDYIQYHFCMEHFPDYNKYIEEIVNGTRTAYRRNNVFPIFN